MASQLRLTKKTNKIIHPISPIYDTSSRILILGSFPSVISRQQGMYYANPQNRFWQVLAHIFQEEIEDKKTFCLEHHIALWDVIHSCTIEHSSDASIRNVTVNDIHTLLDNTEIQCIFTNGKKADALFEQYIQVDLPKINLPSTSSANARYRLSDLIEAYNTIKDYL